jgi:hypothetical protein
MDHYGGMEMDWLYVLFGIVVMIAVAFLFGWTEKHVKSPSTKTSIWIGSIILLLTIRFGWRSSLLFLLLAFRFLESIPSWFFYVAVSGIACFAAWYIFNLIGNSIIELAWELKETNSRIDRMENSISDKLNDISSRLPGRK